VFATGVVFLPLLGAIIAGVFGRVIGDRGAQLVTCGGLILSALCSWAVLAGAVGGEPYKVEVLR
jgi:NADH-quinone oxidoreductase subunit L